MSDSCDPMDYSQQGSSIHGIFQARILEWVAISFSRKSSGPRNQTWVSCIVGRFFTDWAMGETFELWGNAQTLCLGSHFDNIQGVLPAYNLHLVTYVLSTVWALSQILHLGSHVHSLGWPSPRNCTWGHMSTVSRVTPFQDPAPEVLCPQSPWWATSQIMYLGSDISLQGEPTPRTCTWDPIPQSPRWLWTGVTCPQYKVWPHLLYPICGITHPHSPGWHPPRPCTWDPMSTISRITLDQGHMPSDYTLYVESPIHSPRLHPPRPCTWDPMSTISRVTLDWGHMSSVTPPPIPYMWSHPSTVQGYTLPDPAPGVLCPQFPGWPWTGVTCLQSKVWPHLLSPICGVTHPQSPG